MSTHRRTRRCRPSRPAARRRFLRLGCARSTSSPSASRPASLAILSAWGFPASPADRDGSDAGIWASRSRNPEKRSPRGSLAELRRLGMGQIMGNPDWHCQRGPWSMTGESFLVPGTSASRSSCQEGWNRHRRPATLRVTCDACRRRQRPSRREGRAQGRSGLRLFRLVQPRGERGLVGSVAS